MVGGRLVKNLTGRPGPTSADALANLPTSTVYEPASQDDSHPGARVVVIRQAKGQYLVIFAGSGGPFTSNGGDVQVTTVGSNYDNCIVGGWSQSVIPQAHIDCFTHLGAPADSAFALQWMVG
jgi:hypothetical protein